MEIYYKDVAPLVTPSHACPISRMTLLEEATKEHTLPTRMYRTYTPAITIIHVLQKIYMIKL